MLLDKKSHPNCNIDKLYNNPPDHIEVEATSPINTVSMGAKKHL